MNKLGGKTTCIVVPCWPRWPARASCDDSRHYTTTHLAGECAFFLATNRNKKSVTLDLKNPQGRALALRLIAGADIVLENFTNGVMERFGLD